MHAALPQRRAGFTLVELMIVVAIVGILAVLATYGVRKYVNNAKTAEARNAIGQISKDASTAFERESMASIVLGKGATAKVTRALCASATQSVPSAIGSVAGKKYQANPAANVDWNFDEKTNKGFACLKFTIQQPQYYMYNYSSDGDVTVPTTGTAFSVVANGDLDGNGTQSTFKILGSVANNNLFVAPNLIETDPEE
jgi:type IV pilus assembly protein PilA